MTELKPAAECYGEIVSAYQAGDPLMLIIRDFQRNAIEVARDKVCEDCRNGMPLISVPFTHEPGNFWAHGKDTIRDCCLADNLHDLLATLEGGTDD